MCLLENNHQKVKVRRSLAVKEGLKRFQSQVVYPDSYL